MSHVLTLSLNTKAGLMLKPGNGYGLTPSMILVRLKESIGISMPARALENKLRKLINNRIIYPDGTVNSFVQRYLREQVVRLFDPKLKKAAK